jgi:MFS family permease
MLIGTVGGGFLATISLGLPYLFRSATLVLVIVAAWLFMYDVGFEPRKAGPLGSEVRNVLAASITHGFGNRPVRLLMLAAPFTAGLTTWIFYAFQPYILELLGNEEAVYVSGIAAAIFSLAGIVGGASVKLIARMTRTRTAVIALEVVVGSFCLVGVGLASNLPIPSGFWVAILLLTVFALLGAVSYPMLLAYLNDLIPSAQRATVLSFHSLMGSLGGVVSQPLLGRVADIWSLGVGYVLAGLVRLVALPFILLARRLELPADRVGEEADLT